MEFRGKLSLIMLTQLISTTSAYHCEPRTCQTWESCCGDDLCCRNNDMGYNILIAACIFLTLLFLCSSIFFICRYICRILQLVLSNYRNLPRDVESSSTSNLSVPCDVEYDERIYSDPPPPYSEVVQMGK